MILESKPPSIITAVLIAFFFRADFASGVMGESQINRAVLRWDIGLNHRRLTNKSSIIWTPVIARPFVVSYSFQIFYVNCRNISRRCRCLHLIRMSLNVIFFLTAKHYQVRMHWRKVKTGSIDGFRGKLFVTLHGDMGSTNEYALNE